MPVAILAKNMYSYFIIYGREMKTILLSVFMMIFSGCSKISEWVSTPSEPDVVAGVPYENQTEVKLIVPWDWVVFDVKNTKKKSADADLY